MLNLTENDLFTECSGMAVIENETRIVVMYMTEDSNKEAFADKIEADFPEEE